MEGPLERQGPVVEVLNYLPPRRAEVIPKPDKPERMVPRRKRQRVGVDDLW
jgi:hypothetical protein